MSQRVSTDEIESLRIELAELGRSIRSSFRRHTSSFRSSTASRLSAAKPDDEFEYYALQWAEIEKLTSFEQLRSSLFDQHADDDDAGGGINVEKKGKQVVDVRKLGAIERHLFVEKLIKQIEIDNHRLLQKIRNRMDK